MKVKKCGLLLVLFITFGLSFVVFSSVSAVNLDIQVEPVTSWQTTYTFGTTTPSTYCSIVRSGYDAYTTNNGTGPCAINWTFRGFDGLVFNSRYVFEIDTFLYEYRDREPLNAYLNKNADLQFRRISDDTIVYTPNFLGYDVSIISDGSALLRTYFTIPLSSSTGDLTGLYLQWNNYPFAIQPNENAFASAKIPVYQITSQNIQNIINLDNQGVINAINNMNTGNIYSILESLNQIKTQINSNSQSQQQQQQQDQEDRENIENQQSEVESSSSENSEDVASATSSVLQHATDIMAAFNTPATDCLISVQTGANGVLSLNNMNLCQAPNEILTLIRTISTIVITVAVLWLTRSVFITIFEIINDIVEV